MKRQGRKVRWRNLKTTDLGTAKMKDFRHWQRQANKVIAQKIKEEALDAPQTFPAAPEPAPVKQPVANRSLAETYTSWKRTWTCAQGTKDTREYRWKMLCRVLDPEIGLENLTVPRLKEIQAALQADGLSPTTVNDIIGKVLRLCLEHAVEAGWLTRNPATGLKPLKKAQVIRQQHSWDDAWSLVEDACNHTPESGELLKFMLSFGIGQAEIKGLKGEHIDLERDQVSFIRQKTGKLFTVPIFDHAKSFLEGLKAAGRIQAGKSVFGWRDPEQSLRGACKRLNMPFHSIRSLRRTFIVRCLEKGIDARAIGKWQGHRDAKLILDTYGNYVSREHEQVQVAKLKESK